MEPEQGDFVPSWSLATGLDGLPHSVLCAREHVERAFSELPARVLRDAFDRAWAGRDDKPRISTKVLRRRVVKEHLGRLHQQRPLRLSLLDAAKWLGVQPRTLRRQIERGERESVRLQDGTMAVEVPDDRPERWLLIPSRLRPDPRRVA